MVHPKIFKIKDFYRACNDPINILQRGQEVLFEDLLSPDNTNRFSCIVGPLGAGKTTFSNRLAKNEVYELSLHLNFASINYSNPLTLQELLLDKQFANFDFSAEKCQRVFSWIIKNQAKCLLVIDGLDQAQFEIDYQPPNQTYATSLSVSTIIACLFKKIFLPNVRIIVTSRSHAILDLHHSQRPNDVYQLVGLSEENTDKLLRFLSGERYDRFSSTLEKLGPELKSLCACPLLQQMCILSQLNPTVAIGETKTITRMFATMLVKLQLSKGFKTDLNKIHDKLASLAYKTFRDNKVLITWKQMSDENLTEKEIQDLIVTVPGSEEVAFNMLDTNKLLYFSHQIIHEYYCAWYVCNNLSDEDFCKFLRTTKKDNRFIIVRKFVCGLVFDIDRHKGKIF